MNPVRKRFESSAFPFALVYKDTKSSQSELPDHVHDWYELVYVYRGQGTFFIDETFYEMAEGDLFLLPGNTIHRAFPDKDDPVTSTAIFFSPLLVQAPGFGEPFSYLQGFDYCRERRTYKFPQSREAQRTLVDRVDAIHAELLEPRIGSREAVLLHLQHLLLQHIRELDPAAVRHSGVSPQGPVWMPETLRYIDANWNEDIGLSALADRVSVTPAHFSRVFKQRIGMNVSEYLATKRIVKAKELLHATDDNVSSIAERCGFDSLPHFHRLFKRMVGQTPAAYRRTKP